MSFSDKYRRILEQVVHANEHTRIDPEILLKAFEKAGADVHKKTYLEGRKTATITVGSHRFSLHFDLPIAIIPAHKSAAINLLIQYHWYKKDEHDEKQHRAELTAS